MSGHSHFSTIKHKKGTADQKRGQLFSKLLNTVAITARHESNPQFNPQLRTAIEKAKENKVPQEKIEGAIKRASEDKNLEELILEAYGPGGTAVLIEAITDSKNRTIAEVKKILNDNNAKWAEPGSVRWAFEKSADQWQSKFNQEISDEAKNGLARLIQELESHDDVQRVYTNTQL